LFHAIELKLLELVNRFADKVREERGQTTTEYVVVTAIAAAIAMTVLWVALRNELTSAVSAIANEIDDFIANNLFS